MSVGGEAFAQTQNLVRRSGMVRDHALSFGAVLDPHIDPEQKVRQPVSDRTKIFVMLGGVAVVVALGLLLFYTGGFPVLSGAVSLDAVVRVLTLALALVAGVALGLGVGGD